MAAWQEKYETKLRSVILLPNPFDLRNASNDFICRLPDNITPNDFDLVTALADGCLKIITDKASKTDRSGIWSRQSACLLFEVHPF